MKKIVFDYTMTVVIVFVSFPVLIVLGIITFILLIILPKQSQLFLYVYSNILSIFHVIWPKYKGPFPKEGKYIFMFNHGSYIDYFFTALAMGYKRKWVVVFGKNLLKYPIFNYFLKRIGIGVDRNSTDSKIEAFGQMRKALLSGYSVAIFPEGTRMRSYQMDKVLLPFKNGAFSIALELGIPIVPVIFSRTILYSRPDKPLPFSPRVITITFGDPILTEGKTRMSLLKETHEIMEKMIINTP